MIYANRKLQYLFNYIPRIIAEEDKTIELGRLIIEKHHSDICRTLDRNDWDVIHKNGVSNDLRNENLEIVVFKDDDFFKDNKNLEKQMISAKIHAKEQEDIAQKALFEKSVAVGQIELLTKQIAYERDRVKKLNKEINKKDAEIKRLSEIVNNRF